MVVASSGTLRSSTSDGMGRILQMALRASWIGFRIGRFIGRLEYNDADRPTPLPAICTELESSPADPVPISARMRSSFLHLVDEAGALHEIPAPCCRRMAATRALRLMVEGGAASFAGLPKTVPGGRGLRASHPGSYNGYSWRI